MSSSGEQLYWVYQSINQQIRLYRRIGRTKFKNVKDYQKCNIGSFTDWVNPLFV